MYIGEFSRRVGTSTKTIRHYEDIGLLPVAKRKGRYRIYDERYIETVRQIRLAQSFGFTLSRIKQLCENQNIEYGLPRHVIELAISQQTQKLQDQIHLCKQQLSDIEQIKKQLNCSDCA